MQQSLYTQMLRMRDFDPRLPLAVTVTDRPEWP